MIPIRIILSIYFFLVGACLASFTCCAAERYARKESVLKGRSHCDSCGHVLNWIDLLPVIGWVIRGGKCKYCKAKIPATSCISEFLTGCMFVFAFLYLSVFEYSIYAWIRAIFVCAIALVAVVDAEIGEVPYTFQGIFGLLAVLSALVPKNNNWTPATGNIQISWMMLVAIVVMLFSLVVSYFASAYIGQGDVVIFASQIFVISPWCTIFTVMIACMVSLLIFVLAGKKSQLVQSDVEDMNPGVGVRLVPGIAFATVVVLLFQPQLYMILGR